MQTLTGVHLHCGHVDIGHVHKGPRQRTFAHPVQARSCKLPEGSRSTFFGHTAGLKAGETCDRNIRHVKQRSAVQTSAIFGFLRGDAAEKTRKKYQAQVDAINRLEPQMQKLSDEELANKTQDLKQKAQKNGGVDDLLVEAFAVVREGSKRVLGLRPFDVQLIGGMILHNGEIAEMRTGEGKTLVAVLPAYLNALAGKGVQVVTVNDYLARRDSEWVGQVHRFLGLQVGLVQQGLDEADRRAAYNADVTYVTNSELGFDFLRDNLAQRGEDLVLREANYCVIDEVDSILIDEARTPLIISGSAEKPSEKYYKAAKLAEALQREHHYTVDEKQKSVLLTEQGYEDAEDVLETQDLYDPREQWASYLTNALKAKELQIRDVNYIVRGEEVIIVDEFTGRTMPGRRWGEGLHQAVEAKEQLPIQNETITLASISYQNFFRSYKKLAGMTGTAETESSEFQNIYNLPVTVVPTNQKVRRTDESDVVFRTEEGKWSAVVTEIKRMVKTGRPVLVGTTSVERSEMLAGMLREADITCQLLNAKPENVERESEIVAQSGRSKAVTIATNMAGRGTDIILGGNPEYMARLKLRELLMPEVVSQVEGSNPNVRTAKKNGGYRSWKVNPDLFPCELPKELQKEADEAVQAAVKAWGQRGLLELEAEERLAIACEKSPTQDSVIARLRKAFNAMEDEYKKFTADDKSNVVAAGGLMVIGTERHESRRIDNQLRGRSGRQGDPGSTRYFPQGDPGSTRYFLSLEDNLFRIFGGDRIKSLMNTLGVGDLPIESKMLTNSLSEAQRKVESYFFDIRRQLFEYDQVMNTQRDKVYGERRRALMASDLSSQMVEYAERTVDDILEANVDNQLPPQEWPLEALAVKMKQYCYLLEDLTAQVLDEQADGDYELLRGYLKRRAVDAFWQKVEEVNAAEPGLMQDAERFFVLTQTDNLWKEHLQAIKFLQQAVGLRGYAQRDPLVEYKLEGYNLFLEMMANIRRNTIYNVYMFQPAKAAQQRQQQQQQLQQNADSEQNSTEEAVVDVAANANASPSSNGSKQKNGASQNGSSRGKQSRKSKQRDTSKSK